MDRIPQVFKELQILSHVAVQCSSTLKSYTLTTDFVGLFRDKMRKQVQNRKTQLQFFETQQGISLRKVMFQHYQRLIKILDNEHNILSKVTQSIHEKHKMMENSRNFIKPIIVQITRKSQNLDKQLFEVVERIKRLKNIKLSSQDSQLSLQNFLQNKSKQSESLVFSPEKEKSVYEINGNQEHFSLISNQFIDQIKTQGQLRQAQIFLDIKVQQVQQFVKIQEQLARVTVKKIFEIFDETKGKGFQKLKEFIRDRISFKSQYKNQNSSIPQLPLKDLQERINSDCYFQSHMDLSCDENLEDIMGEKLTVDRLKLVRKKLYDTPRSIKEQEEQSQYNSPRFENNNSSVESSTNQDQPMSPTFKFAFPLVIDTAEDITKYVSPNQEQKPMQCRHQPPSIYDDDFSLIQSLGGVKYYKIQT